MLPMRSLGETGLQTSALGLGCADLFREPSRSRRRRLLEAALDAGVCHFDCAPMYGLGDVEREIGRFARGRRDAVVIATKFGIAPAPAARALARVQGPIQRLLNAVPALREQARPAASDPRAGIAGSFLYRTGGFGVAAARASLERSLRELGTDYVDLLFLHDPARGAVESDDVRDYLEEMQTAGRIRAWGVAGEGESIDEIARILGPGVPVLQVPGDVFRPAAARAVHGGQGLILFGVLGRPLPRILAHVRSDETVRRRWSDAVGEDCGRAETIASLLLREALNSNERRGAVLFSTTRPERIVAAASAAGASGPDPALAAFRALLQRELVAAEPAR
jgi:D-threo-aldose 1-dehydrogenase